MDHSKQLNINECEDKTSSRRYVLPEIICNFPAKRNTLHSIEENEEWIRWLFVHSGMNELQFAKLKGVSPIVQYLYPFCGDVERMEILVKLCVGIFIYDDHAEQAFMSGEGANSPGWVQFEKVLDYFDNKQFVSMKKWEPYVFSMFATLNDMYEKYDEIQKYRSIREYRNSLKSFAQEMELIKNCGIHISVDEYIQIRVINSTTRVVIQAIEYSDNINIADNLWNDPRMQTLIDLAAKHTTLLNDIFSFENEFKHANLALDKTFNLVAVVSINEGLEIEKSMERVAQMLVTIEKEMFELGQQLLTDENSIPVTKVFIDSLYYLCGGNYQFCRVCDRYSAYINL